MRSLILVTASGLAREVLEIERGLGRYASIVVADDDPRLWGSALDEVPIVGGLDAVVGRDDADVVVCAGRGSVRRTLVGRLAALGVSPTRFATVVSPTARVGRSCSVGPGSILLDSVVLTVDVRVGAHVVAMPHVTMTHDDVVEDFATMCTGVSLGGGVRVGEASYLGMNSAVREGVVIGEGAVLGMAAALVESLPARATWAGVPARALDSRPVARRAR